MTDNKVTFDSADGSIIQTVVQIDGLGRAARTAKTGFVNGNNGWNVSGAVEYDTKGRTVREGMTEFIEGDMQELLGSLPQMTELSTSYEYDQKDRKTRTVLPDGSVQKDSYETKEGKSVVRTTDPMGNISLQEIDSFENIVRTEKFDMQGNSLTHVTYSYNAIGEMLEARDAKDNPIRVSYDMLGRKTILESLDSGRYEYEYDEVGNLKSETNSVLRRKGKKITYEYDGLNRLAKIDYPETADTVYVYGDENAGLAAGKILSVTDASGVLSYEYGKLGEVTKETRVLTSHVGHSQTRLQAVMEYRSDYLGRMQWIVYPDGEKVTYGYDNGGQVVSITGEHYGQEFVYVTNILYDQYGQRTRIEYGNGTFTDYECDPARRWLSSIRIVFSPLYIFFLFSLFMPVKDKKMIFHFGYFIPEGLAFVYSIVYFCLRQKMNFVTDFLSFLFSVSLGFICSVCTLCLLFRKLLHKRSVPSAVNISESSIAFLSHK